MKICKDTPIIFLWRNRDCVVFGRNQNIYNECNMEFMRKLDVLPVRRITGGGAVFHDKNNLNFSFIAPKELFTKEKSMQIVQNALLNLNIPAEISGRNDILVNNMKISGNAYYSTNTQVLHHGTLLIDTNIEKMGKVLSVDKMKLKSHGVRSVKSRVVNLKEIYPKYSTENYEQALKEAFTKHYSGTEEPQLLKLEEKNLDEIEKLSKLYQSEEWIFGHSGKGEYEKRTKYNWGSLTVIYFTKKGSKRVKIYSDTLYVNEFGNIKEQIENTDFDKIEKNKYENNSNSKEWNTILKDTLDFILI